MRRTHIALIIVLVAATTAIAVERIDAARGVGAAITSAGRTARVAWTMPFGGDGMIGCKGFTFSSGVNRTTKTMLILADIADGRLTDLELFDADCGDRATNVTHTLINPSVDSSIDYLRANARHAHEAVAALALHDSTRVVPALESLAAADNGHDVREQALFWLGQRGGERGYQYLRDFIRTNDDEELLEKAVFSLSQSDAEGATDELIALARGAKGARVRRQAIFWLGQKAGEKASAELRRAVDADPDDDVKEHAVFAISQLPRERSVPMLIDLARTHKSPGVREKALFWLAQSGDPRALDLIEEILK